MEIENKKGEMEKKELELDDELDNLIPLPVMRKDKFPNRHFTEESYQKMWKESERKIMKVC